MEVEFKHKNFQEVVDYPPFEHVVEIVDHPPLIEILIYIFFWPCPFQKRNSSVHGINYYYPYKYAIRKSIASWVHCTFTRKPKIGNIWKHFEGVTNKLARKVSWHIFNILRFCQPSMFHHPTSLAPVSKWSDPSWIHWHLIIKHNFIMVCTSFGMLISF